MKSSIRAFFPGLIVGCLLLAASVSAGIPPPPRGREWRPLNIPLDLRRIVEGKELHEYPPGVWCPSGPDFSAWIESRKNPSSPLRNALFGKNQSKPTITYGDGFILMEDGGTLLRNDNLFDLPTGTLEFAPSGSGYTVSSIPSAYEPDVGGALFTDAYSWKTAAVDLGSFAFPFGGKERTRFWVTSAIALTFEAPVEPVPDRFCTTGCYYRKIQVLLDRTPRIAPLQHGASLYGWNAYYREAADRAVITWRASWTGLDLDVQTVLFPDGRIRLNYAAVEGIRHGVAAVISENDAWWSDVSQAGQGSDPRGDVIIPAPDGPSMDFTGASAFQVAGTEILQIELQLAQALPASTEQDIYFYITLKDEATDPEPFKYYYFVWSNGRWLYRTCDVEDLGATVRFTLDRSEFTTTDDDLFLGVYSFRYSPSYQFGDAMPLEISYPLPASPVMLDLSKDLPVTVEAGPIFEAFTLPELMPFAVQEALYEDLDDPKFDGIAIWQNFDTDIVFFAGGYHAGGQAATDGIGTGASIMLETPSLLHLSNIYRIGTTQWFAALCNHEFGHRWLYFIQIDEGGIPTGSLNPDGVHPAGWVHTPGARPVLLPDDFSCMGGSDWTDNGGGTFTSQDYASGSYVGYSWTDLYLMGLASPQEVPDWFYLDDSNPPINDAYWAPSGMTVNATKVPVSLSQVVAAEGPRFPAYPHSRSSFRVPIVLVARPGEYTQEEIDFMPDVCPSWAWYFRQATALRGAIRCAMHPPEVEILVPAGDPVIPVGSTIDFEGAGRDTDGDGVRLTWNFSGVAPETTGAGPHPVTFGTTGVFPVTLSGVDETGMKAATPDVVTVTVECPNSVPPDRVKPLKIAREGPSLRFVWPDLTTGASDYVVLGAPQATGLYLPAGSASSGSPGLQLPAPLGTAYFKVAARYPPGCLGPY